MDIRKGKLFANYKAVEIEEFFRRRPEAIDSKHGRELLVGCVLAYCSQKIKGELPEIGYMMKDSYSSSTSIQRPELQDIIGHDFMEDRDVDIWLQYKKMQTKIQISCLEVHKAGKDPNKGLIEIIKRKSIVQPDPYLQLVIFIDHTFEMSLPPFSGQTEKIVLS